MLPALGEVVAGIERIYASGIVTNMGALHQELEGKLRVHLGGSELVLFNNGTTALVAALSAMDLPPGSEVITTPFSFAATAHAISAVGLTPVFADVEPQHMTLDPADVVRKITSRTSCILPVHVYGFPCDVQALAQISTEHNLRVVYDAAHAFGSTIGKSPIAHFGDASVFSFHATKLFSTVEGGCVVINTENGGHKLRRYRNFGIKDEDTVDEIGLNGKMSEFHALFGLLNLDACGEEMNRRRIVRETYTRELSNCPLVQIPDYPADVGGSYQYFPIRIQGLRESVYHELRSFNVFARRYFYPLISNFNAYKHLPSANPLPEAQKAAQEVLCLPFYGDLADGTAREIARLLRSLLDAHVS